MVDIILLIIEMVKIYIEIICAYVYHNYLIIYTHTCWVTAKYTSCWHWSTWSLYRLTVSVLYWFLRKLFVIRNDQNTITHFSGDIGFVIYQTCIVGRTILIEIWYIGVSQYSLTIFHATTLWQLIAVQPVRVWQEDKCGQWYDIHPTCGASGRHFQKGSLMLGASKPKKIGI